MAKRLERGRNLETERKLTDRGFTWEFHPDMPLSEIDEEKSLRNQARLGTPVRPDVVDNYEGLLRDGVEFPAIVAATQQKGGHLNADGNHRFVAHKQAGMSGIPTYLIIDGDPQAVALYTYEANTTHGLRTTDEDRLHSALWMVDNGMPMEDAARRVGIPVTKVRQANTLHRAAARADEVGLNPRDWEGLGSGVRARLMSVSTDEGFKELANLAVAAKLTAPEVSEHVGQLGSLRSSAKQVDYVHAVRQVNAERIGRGGTPKTKGKRTVTPRAQLSLALGQVQALPSPETVTLLWTDGERADMLAKVEAAIDRLQELAKVLT